MRLVEVCFRSTKDDGGETEQEYCFKVSGLSPESEAELLSGEEAFGADGEELELSGIAEDFEDCVCDISGEYGEYRIETEVFGLSVEMWEVPVKRRKAAVEKLRKWFGALPGCVTGEIVKAMGAVYYVPKNFPPTNSVATPEA